MHIYCQKVSCTLFTLLSVLFEVPRSVGPVVAVLRGIARPHGLAAPPAELAGRGHGRPPAGASLVENKR